MGEKPTTTEKIVEEVDGDNLVFRLLVNDKEMSYARTLHYDFLVYIQATKGEEGKGYGRKLLTHIEKLAKEHNAKVMKTSDIDPCDYKTISFFKSMGYRLKPVEGDKRKFLEAEKPLENEILELIRWIDKQCNLFGKWDWLGNRMWLSFAGLIVILLFIFAYSILILADFLIYHTLMPDINLSVVAIALSFLAVVISYFSFVAQFEEKIL
jgi:hypothetical protein